MSFILDALKKSESERQRKAGPALYEVKLAPPRNRLPWWMMTVGALLGINLVFVVWLLMRSPSKAPPAAPAAAPPIASAAPVPAPASPAQAPPGRMAPAPASGGSPTLTAAVPPGNAAVPPAAGSSAQLPGAALTGPAGVSSPLAAGATGAGAGAGNDDLAPAVEPSGNAETEHVRTTTEAGLPSYREIAATNNRIPPLHLDFHLYSPRPQDRFVFINMKKLHEGDATPEGVRVESINDEGAVLSFEGTRFTLLHE